MITGVNVISGRTKNSYGGFQSEALSSSMSHDALHLAVKSLVLW